MLKLKQLRKYKNQNMNFSKPLVSQFRNFFLSINNSKAKCNETDLFYISKKIHNFEYNFAK